MPNPEPAKGGTPLVLIAAAVTGLSCMATAQETWQPRTSPVEAWLAGTAWGGGVYVAVGEEGDLANSTDGETWTAQSSGTTEPLRGIAYGAGRFVTVGRNGVCTTSTDGTNWTSGSTDIGGFASGVAYGDGTFVACGSSGRVSRSTDGQTWTSAGTGVTFKFLQSIAYGGGAFVIVSGDGLVVRSTDGGLTWETADSGTSLTLTGVTYGDGKFIAVGIAGVVIVSDDSGATWTRIQHNVTNRWMQAATFGGGTFVIAGDGGTVISSSGDLSSWEERDSNVTTQISALGFGDGKFVGVGGSELDSTIVTSDAPVVVEECTFEDFQAEHFDEDELLDDSISGHLADPDGDRLANFLEYALGLHPRIPSAGASAIPSIGIASEGENEHMTITFERPTKLAQTVTYSLVRTTTLEDGSWQPVPGATETILNDDGTTQTVRFSDPSPISTSEQAFCRLLVE